jgi:hypothetical protein
MTLLEEQIKRRNSRGQIRKFKKGKNGFSQLKRLGRNK